MTEPTDRCPKCDGAMEQGFIVGTQHGPQSAIQSWAPGAPRRSFWFGVALPESGTHPVATFRCASCGYLESYARPGFEAKKK